MRCKFRPYYDDLHPPVKFHCKLHGTVKSDRCYTCPDGRFIPEERWHGKKLPVQLELF